MTIKRIWIALGLILAGLVMLGLPGQALAGSLGQNVYQTPTPLPDGRILYIVQPGDTCLRVSLLTGVSLDQIRKLNNLDLACTINAGQKLLIALAGPAIVIATPGPSPTSGPIVPSATPFHGNGEVCVAVFDDVNGDATRQDTETIIPDAAVSLTDRLGTISKTATTTAATDPLCFQNIPEGDYNISVAVPEGFNPTTVMNYALTVKAGDQALVDFGAQLSAQAVPLAPAEGGHSPLLGLIGGVLLVVGAGLGVYVFLHVRNRPPG
jgi:LysM repeat protein